MAMGAVLLLIFASFAALVIVNYVEWDNSTDALTTVAMVCAPPIALSLFMIGGGRALYGGRHAGTPIRNGLSWMLQVCGGGAGAVAGIALFMFIFAGVRADERMAVVKLGVAVIVGLGVAGIGWLLRPRDAMPKRQSDRPA